MAVLVPLLESTVDTPIASPVLPDAAVAATSPPTVTVEVFAPSPSIMTCTPSAEPEPEVTAVASPLTVISAFAPPVGEEEYVSTAMAALLLAEFVELEDALAEPTVTLAVPEPLAKEVAATAGPPLLPPVFVAETEPEVVNDVPESDTTP